ncbi:MAG: endopeptidase La [Planctomycetota bacterium]
MPDEPASKQKIVGEDGPEVTVTTEKLGGAGAELLGEEVAVPTETAVLPVRNMVIFPGTVVPLAIGREKSRRLLSDVLPAQKVIVVTCQKDSSVDDPKPEDLYPVGTAVMILKLLRMEEGGQSIIVQGMVRVRIHHWLAQKPYIRGKVRVLRSSISETTESEALTMNTRNLARRALQLMPNVPEEAVVVLDNIQSPGALADFLASNLQLDIPTKQKILRQIDIAERLRTVSVELQRQIEVLELSNKIQEQVKARIDKTQRQYFLQEQLKAIQEELGQLDERGTEVEQLRERIEAAGMNEAIRKECLRELDRMAKIPTASPEYNVVRTYLDWMTELPWSGSGKATKDRLDIRRARRILDADHYNLEKVKKRILEYLAVRKLAPESRGPILCFVGPPGVGKTSLGMSIARALGRKFIRMSLGGMRDEAELRGHRRTYIGAMPGRIVQEIRKADTINPVFMLDELDKVGADFRGDPTSALLEVLDPAQNSTFQDHYLNVPFDLSKVLFIGTANYVSPVPPALRDRMEVIELPGYTLREKLHIAMRYLVPRQLTENGLKPSQAKWSKAAVRKIIESYTRESGVRELERQIGAVCRGVAAMIAGGEARSRSINGNLVGQMLGPGTYESEVALRTSTTGVATGLAYTPAGGDIIFIEATSYPGKGAITLTGQIGDVMRESAQAALSLLRSHAGKLGLEEAIFAGRDVHVHVPAGAVPKDGPSAGVAMVTALTSMFTGKPVRSDVAMTGEITLRGLVLPVGGIKFKVLAAKQAGIKTVVLPARNQKDLVDIPADARRSLKFQFADTVDDVLKVALVADRKPREGKRGKRR